jgi:hypothetical protein
MQDELDKSLQLLFQEQSRNMPEEPFLSGMFRIIEKHRRRRAFLQALIPFLGFACCAVLSPFLVKGSVILSEYIAWIFNMTGNLLDRPAGRFATALCCIVLLGLFRRRLFSAFVWNPPDPHTLQ